ncbi:lantibiotic dehydratase [Pedobacter sp. PAMC26386]|nr:lantibiotic dehydratase [Pedobacter sp. PAMC26386]
MLQPEDFYLLRSPYLSINTAEDLLNNHDELFSLLTAICQNKGIKEAIYIASPVLFREMEKMLEGKITEEKSTNRILQSLLKYILRASSRATPYGMFAGTSMGTTAQTTKITVGERHQHKSFTRLDMDFLDKIIESLAKNPQIKPHLSYTPNSSWYRVADKINYLETEMLKQTSTYSLSSVDYSEYLQEILEKANIGLNREKLYLCLDAEDFSEEEVANFIEELIDNQLLVHNLKSSPTSENALLEVIDKIASIADKTKDQEIIKYLNQLNKIDSVLSSDLFITEKRKIVTEVVSVFFDALDYSGDFFQVDLSLATLHNQINKNILIEITQQISEIALAMKINQPDDLGKFKDIFLNRYEGQELPLNQVLDTEYGIGYGNANSHSTGISPLVNEVNGGSSPPSKIFSKDFLHDMVQQKLFNALHMGNHGIEITQQDINSLNQNKTISAPLADSAYILGTITSRSPESVDKGEYNFILNAFTGPTSSAIITRFCYTDNRLYENVKACIKKEENDTAVIYAEIIHMPQSRQGNIINRPAFREFEIPFLTAGSVPREKQINVDDLMVRVTNGKIILRSQKLNKRVIPRLTTAHNFRFASLPIYKFLCDLQFQGTQSYYMWNWANFSDLPFLPRVTFKKIILSPAIWNITIKSLYENKETIDQQAIIPALKQFQKKYSIPNKVLLIEGDNRLLIDFTNQLSLEILQRQFISSKTIVISEFLYGSDQCFMENQSQEKFVNEIVIPVSKISKPQTPTQNSPIKNEPETLDRRFTLGSEWVYIKIYGGLKTLDNILRTDILYLTEYLKSNAIIDKWFYIRYQDPEMHIRLRFHLSNESDWKDVISAINIALEDSINNGSIYNIVYDTYEREMERYKSLTIIPSEDLFCVDSYYALKLLSISEGDQYERIRWMIATLSIDDYLNYFKLSLNEKSKLTQELAKGFYLEFGDSVQIERSLNGLYRSHSQSIKDLFEGKITETDHWVENTKSLLHERKQNIQPIVDRISTLQANAGLQSDLYHLIPSYMHMSINRFFFSYQRKYEMIIYHFLHKYYNSRLAREKIQDLNRN